MTLILRSKPNLTRIQARHNKLFQYLLWASAYRARAGGVGAPVHQFFWDIYFLNHTTQVCVPNIQHLVRLVRIIPRLQVSGVLVKLKVRTSYQITFLRKQWAVVPITPRKSWQMNEQLENNCSVKNVRVDLFVFLLHNIYLIYVCALLPAMIHRQALDDYMGVHLMKIRDLFAHLDMWEEVTHLE